MQTPLQSFTLNYWGFFDGIEIGHELLLVILRQRIEQTPIDRVFVPKLVDCAYLGPFVELLQIKHTHLRDVTVTTDFVEVSVTDNGKTWCTSWLTKFRKYGPFVCLNIIHFTCYRAFLPMPRANCYQISVLPRDKAMGIPLVVHIC